ncbi:MAG: hypothetical protein IJX64_05490 [Clostridia bacterium]|nr:hypothetical protein [Clostridia bacterium]
MAKTYFPGANTGRGFVSRFGGIIPPWEKPQYTYVLKGGPGVGKNTLMKTVASRAVQKGYTVEEFHCASDPDSLDAVRVTELGIVLLDGTAPHSIDPVLPGVDEEILDLGYFKNRKEFALHRGELQALFRENKAHYDAAYAFLGAAYALKKQAIAAAKTVVDMDKMRCRLSETFADAKEGAVRALFARSATPLGVVDYTETYLPNDTLLLSGIVGEIALAEAEKLLAGKRAEIFYDFILPEQPRTVIASGRAIALGEGGETLQELCAAPLPDHVVFCLEQTKILVEHATEELAKSLATHDAIEAIYHPYVDYDRVNTEREILLKTLGI